MKHEVSTVQVLHDKEKVALRVYEEEGQRRRKRMVVTLNHGHLVGVEAAAHIHKLSLTGVWNVE